MVQPLSKAGERLLFRIVLEMEWVHKILYYHSLIAIDLDLFVVLRGVEQPGSYCDG